jgi:proteic killer suppression protein
MIVSFGDADTKLLWETGRSRRIPSNLRRVALRKLMILNAALELDNLRVPPNNRLEELAKDRKGQYSIRVNDQYRICFGWNAGNALDVEVVDYH